MKKTGKLADDIGGIVQDLARLGDVYWHPDCFPKRFERAANSWLEAVVQFAADYSYERQQASPRYREFAEQAIRAACSSSTVPSPRLAERVWADFRSRCEAAGIGPNWKVNVLSIRSGHKVSVLEFLSALGSSECNMLRWAQDVLSRGMAEEATKQLRGIRGIGWKLAAFYLRDVCDYSGMDEKACGPLWCFQPVDVWVERVAEILGGRLRRRVRGYDDAAGLLVELAEEAGVRGGRLNAGAWILGSQLVESADDLIEALSSRRALQECLSDNLRWCRAVEGVLSFALR